MMARGWNVAFASLMASLAVCAVCAVCAGCKSSAPAPASGSAPRSQGSNQRAAAQALSPLDPCPERLHDIAGALLNFMRQYDRLPPTLEDLTPIGGTTLVTACPLSSQKYIYNPNGIKFPPARWAIVYDAAPSHSNMRWAIVFSEPREGRAPIPTVVAISEADFRAASELPIPNR